MTNPFWIVDAFTPVAFKGNPAAVVILPSFPEDAAMQRIAAQMNLSETAFLVKRAPQEYDLRWFSPEVEVRLCGHATLASMHILRQEKHIATGDSVTFHTLSGPLAATALEKSIELDFPTLAGEPAKPHTALKALGVDIQVCERNRDNYLIEVTDFAALAACAPNFKKLASHDAQGVIVTTAKGVPAGFDFASRYFAPSIGVNEDPVTGSAHCFLAPYWAKKLGKTVFRAYQASKGQGILNITLAGDRVLIAGQAVTALKGHLEPIKEHAA